MYHFWRHLIWWLNMLLSHGSKYYIIIYIYGCFQPAAEPEHCPGGLGRGDWAQEMPNSQGLYSFLATYRFVASVHLQADVLLHFSRLSKVFQKVNVNFLALKDQVLNQYFIFDTIDHTLLILIRYLQLRLNLLCLSVIRSLWQWPASEQ